MSCKYCELKRRKDDDVEWVAGEDWKSDSDDGGYICPNDDGFRMLVYYDGRCACTAVDNIKYCPFCGAKLAMPKEPLIKDERIRRAVRAWVEIGKYEHIYYDRAYNRLADDHDFVHCIEFAIDPCPDAESGRCYTLTELCGEDEE